MRLYGVFEEHSQRKDERAERGRGAYAVSVIGVRKAPSRAFTEIKIPNNRYCEVSRKRVTLSAKSVKI